MRKSRIQLQREVETPRLGACDEFGRNDCVERQGVVNDSSLKPVPVLLMVKIRVES